MDESPEETPLASKRRRKIKANADKKYECKYGGCGKTYSRAEHLYRHHLNHEPKAIYHCQHPGCNRNFVRQDLCVRHQERHSSQGSQLQKRDASSQLSPSTDRREASLLASSNQAHSPPISASLDTPIPARGEDYAASPREHTSHPPRHGRISESIASNSSTSIESRVQPTTPRTVLPALGPFLRPEGSPTGSTLSPPQKTPMGLCSRLEQRTNFSADPERPFSIAPASSTSYAPTSYHGGRVSADETAAPAKERPNSINSFHTDTHYAQSTVGFSGSSAVETSSTSIATAVAHSLSALDPLSSPHYPLPGDTSAVDLAAAFTYPIFGGDEYNRSPITREAEFAAWLFNENQQAMSNFVPAPNLVPGYVDIAATHIQGPFYPDRQFDTYYPPHVQPQHPMSVMSLLDPTSPTHTCMSEEKRQELLDLMKDQFQERPHDAVKGCKNALIDGDLDADDHILSLRMLHSYIGSYFYHQHAQLPILHRPTFCADKTHNLLLLIVIAIGAATLDKAYGNTLTDIAADFANFIAWHVRWEIVRDEGYRPPAKLWVFQTLILLEVYEKMYSTRALHERAHINHDTTLTLMRRGTSFIGRTANESPGSLRDGKTARSSGSNSASDAVASDESWSQWTRNEATRRIAFGAFVIDSIHATMFGHSAKMVAYEIHLPLPCDEALWSATSAAEVARVQSSHQTNGVKPTMFLDGLKRTLNGEKVRTNSFGRTILMCGLLSVNYLLSQRDLQITALGAPNMQSSGSSSKWRSALLRAFDNWKKDFDDTLAEAHPSSENHSSNVSTLSLRRIDDDNLFESRIVLHHLAHMASCVDVVDCQIYAGARRLLGRPIGIKDFARVREKMVHRWCKTSNARDAAFHALQFLIQVLVQPGEAGAVTILPHAFDDHGRYVARDDFLLNRPWVLYFSALVVWCYGFALEGPLSPPPPDSTFDTPAARESDMRAFLCRFGSGSQVRTPADLASVVGMNHSVGLLMVLKDSFEATRWELTHEAALLLKNCIDKLLGKM